jgi:hypothetical protein
MALSTYTWTHAKKAAIMQEYLESMTVARAISDFVVGKKFIHNPFPTPGAVTVNSPMTGLYTPVTLTTNDDSLEVNREAIYNTHLFDFETTFADYNLANEVFKIAAAKLAEDMDRELLAILAAGAGNTVSVPGGFTKTNVFAKVAEADGHLSGYVQGVVNGMYIVIGNTSKPAFVEAGATAGFNYADSTLMNGLFGKLFNFDIYVVRNTQMPVDTAIAGVKKASTTGIGGAIKIEEKQVSGKTGIEWAAINYSRSALWNNNEPLVVKFDLGTSS